MRFTVLQQAGTNNVATFVRIVNKILARCRDISRAFLDDVGMDGPRTKYNNELAAPGVRRYVLEYIQNLDRVLCDIERSGATISGMKSEFCKDRLKAVGFIYDDRGRHPVPEKIAKVHEWKACKTPKEIRAFLGLCVYYRVWIKDFSIVANPMYHVLKKNVEFYLSEECSAAMEALKVSLTNATALSTIDYSTEAGDIVFAVDARGEGWGAILQQEKDGKRHPVRYESGVSSAPEKTYDAGKRECRALLRALKKLKVWLYGVKFVVEIDAKTLLHQLNLPIVDLPGDMVTRWITWIQLFDFNVRHVPGRKHSGPDGLSRWPADDDDDDDCDSVEDCVDADLGVNSVNSVGKLGRQLPIRFCVEDSCVETGCVEKLGQRPPMRVNVAEIDIQIAYMEEYDEHHHRVIWFLQTLQVPAEIAEGKERHFRKAATQYHIAEGMLFRRNTRGRVSRKVICRENDKKAIMTALYEEGGHRGREGTTKKILERYWRKNVYRDKKEHVKSFHECQQRLNVRVEEVVHPNLTSVMWSRVCVDVVHMPKGVGACKYLVVAREDVSGWPEARAIRKANSQTVAKFLEEDVFSRHGCPTSIVVDRGSENKGIVDELCAQLRVAKHTVTAYHPQANGLVERGHKQIVDGLSKLCSRSPGKWPNFLTAILWADRTMTRKSTGFTPFQLIYGRQCLLPIELQLSTWHTLWDRPKWTTAELLALRVEQLKTNTKDVNEAVTNLKKSRLANKAWFDKKK